MIGDKTNINSEIDFGKERKELFKYVIKRTPSLEDAEDITQRSLLKFLQNKSKDTIRTPQAFLRKVAHDEIVDFYRDKIKTNKISTEEKILEIKTPIQLRSIQTPPAESEWSVVVEKLPIFKEIKRAWGGLDIMRQILNSPHREVQTLTLLLEADEYSKGALLDKVSKKLRIPIRDNKKILFKNDLSSPCPTNQQKEHIFYLSTIFPNQESYDVFLERLNKLEEVLNFPVKGFDIYRKAKVSPDIARVIKKRLKDIKITSSVARECLVCALFLENPRTSWRLTTIYGPATPTKTYSKSFFRDYFMYLMLKNRVQLSGMEKFIDIFLDGKADEDYKLLGGEILMAIGRKLEYQDFQKLQKQKDHFKKFNTGWYLLDGAKYENIKKQSQSFRKQIESVRKKVLQFTK